MVELCLAVIATCEVVRIIQLELSIRHDKKAKENIYAEFIKSLKASDREWVRQMLKKYEEMNDEENPDTF